MISIISFSWLNVGDFGDKLLFTLLLFKLPLLLGFKVLKLLKFKSMENVDDNWLPEEGEWFESLDIDFTIGFADKSEGEGEGEGEGDNGCVLVGELASTVELEVRNIDWIPRGEEANWFGSEELVSTNEVEDVNIQLEVEDDKLEEVEWLIGWLIIEVKKDATG